MLGSLRGFINTTVGKVMALLILIVAGLAFALGDITGSRGMSGGAGGSGETLVTIGGEKIASDQFGADTQRLFDQNRQQFPQLQMAEFIAKGGFDQPLITRTNTLAIVAFAESIGIRIGKNLVDSEIAQIPAFRGLDGKFDKNAYLQTLQQQGLTDRQVHDEIGQSILVRMLVGPLTRESMGAPPVAVNYATPYASMLLEKRTGTVAFISTRAIPEGAPVTDAEARDYYKRNLARYTLPERRVVRYAEVKFADVRAKATPTDAEVAQAYAQSKDKFAASETRDIRQVVVADKAGADALAAKVRGGTAIDAAAKAIGLDAQTLTAQKKADYAAQAGTPVADQVFGAPAGAVIGPLRTPLGWAVIKLDKVTAIAGKSADQARPELIKTLTDQKATVAINDLHEKIANLIASSTPLEEIARQLGLTLTATPALDAQGADPAAAAPAKPDDRIAPLVGLGFATTVDDDPQMIQSAQDGSFYLAKLDKVIPASAKPLAAVADQVKKDFVVDRQVRQGRTVAQGVVDRVNKGMPLGTALAGTGLRLDPTKPLSGNRAQLVTTQRPPQPLILLFSMPARTAKLLQAPYKGGWFVVVADTITRGDARGQPDLVKKMRGDLGRALGNEYSQQLARAIRDQVGVKRDEAAIGRLKATLAGGGGAAEQ